MIIIGCDFHPSWQQIAWLDTETGESGEQKLGHAGGEAEQFYQQVPAPALVGMESTGNCQWGAGPSLLLTFLGLILTEAAPPSAVFRGWEPMRPGSRRFSIRLRYTGRAKDKVKISRG